MWIKLTIRATKSVLKGSSVSDSMLLGSQVAISRSSLYATCSAFSRRRRSMRSSFVSTRVGGGVSFGSWKCQRNENNTEATQKFTKLPQNGSGRRRLQHSLASSSREVAYLVAANTESAPWQQIMPANLAEETASLFFRCFNSLRTPFHLNFTFWFWPSSQ